MAHYLVTGAAGFIASRVTQQLLAAGHTVAGVDNLNDAYDVRLKEWRLAQLQAQPGFRFWRGDICDQAFVADVWRNGGPFEAVINLAARAGVRYSVENPWVYFDTNVTGTLNLLEQCRQAGPRKFILSSSSSVYGVGNPMPYREDSNTDLPLSPYAASKKAAEAACHSYHHLHNLDITVFRYFTVYGPAGRPDMAPFRFTQWISEGRPLTVFGDGTQRRDFTFVEDIARGTIAGLRPVGYAVLNLGSDHPIALRELIQTLEQLLDRPAKLIYKPPHPADVTATWADITRAETVLGWRPTTSLAQGLEALVAWYRANREWARTIDTA